RDRVRELLPRLAAVFADSESGKLSNGVAARFDYGRDLRRVYEENMMLDRRNGDDRILASVLGLRLEAREVVLVSGDLAMRLRARALGIRAKPVPEKYENKYADPLRAENAKLRRELDQVRSALPKLEVALLEGGQTLTLTLPPVSRTSR